LISLDSAYHGDTLGSVGLGYVEAFHGALRHNIVPSIRFNPPHIYRFYHGDSEQDAVERSLGDLRAILAKDADSIAGCIIEPMAQGAAGVWTHPAKFLRAVSELCRKHDVLLIADEVATGFGKTGALFAVEHANICPDVLVMGKALSAGYLPISAAVATERMFEGFLGSPEEKKTFYFGQTFCGNPLAARVSLRNLQLFRERDLVQKVRERIPGFHRLLQTELASHPHVDEVRTCGLMCAIELTSVPGQRVAYEANARIGPRIVAAARARGVIIRPLGNCIILMPALAMEAELLQRLVDATQEAIAEVTKSGTI
jgi:adenosylmethionine-8-amino-7-oxononanoate aminotransferase